MKRKEIIIPFLIIAVTLLACNVSAQQSAYEPTFPMGEFVRPTGVNPILSPDSSSVFLCPMNNEIVRWEESDAFNPGAVVKDGKIYVLYRAEDNSATGIGKRVSRVALASSHDGIEMRRHGAPVLYPDNDNKRYEWPGDMQQQKKTVTGTIVDDYGEPIIGANIIEKGTTNGTVTDYDGNFSISVANNAVLHISYI